MEKFKSDLFWQSIIVSVLCFFSYWFFDDLLGDFKILRWVPILFFLTAMLILVGKAIVHKFIPPILIGFVTIVPLSITVSKSRVLFSARLIDERSAVVLSLKEDKSFILSYETIVSAEEETGKYNIEGDRIILNERDPKRNEFVPDTLTVFDNKVVMNFDSLGKPIISFANHFQIEQNRFH